MNEQRASVRHNCPSGPGRQLFFLGSDAVLNANVTDVSTQGIAFVSQAGIEPGTHLLMEVLSPHQGQYRVHGCCYGIRGACRSPRSRNAGFRTRRRQ
jgi:hypothetical protein